ncbi:hypothetical protein PanWU01x14_348090 [Parasponia andersonii]|uniref:Uncharacterized protein n=1 Tax=Parasponia andersonii TaxID=3476 RepID=A0A2P5ABS0_PARAD|nr:hypothetical protein PanWU01x14_348090 [Parasponia andersonii]
MIESLINLNLCMSYSHTHSYIYIYMHGRAHVVTRIINWRFVEAACEVASVAAYGRRWVCGRAPALPSCPLDQVCLLQERASYSPFEAPHDVMVGSGMGLVLGLLASQSSNCLLCHHPTTSSFPLLASLRSSFEPN